MSDRSYVVGARLADPGELLADDLSSFLYDTVLLHDAIVLATDPRYEKYEFNRWFYSRNGRPLVRENRLELGLIRYESPGLIEVATSAAMCVTAIVFAYERLRDRSQRRRKLVAEADKAVDEARIARVERVERERALEERESARGGTNLWLPDDVRKRVQERGAARIVERQVERIEQSTIPVEKVLARREPERLSGAE
jgi:hypothetical protein